MRGLPGALACLLLAVGGCDRYESRLPETGATLEGEVTYGNEKVPLAMIVVLGEKGQAMGTVEEGKYKVENAPLGEVRIGVNSEALRSQIISQQMASSYKGPGSKGGSRAPAPRFVDVPAKYREPDTSGVTTTVKRGANTFDINLSK